MRMLDGTASRLGNFGVLRGRNRDGCGIDENTAYSVNSPTKAGKRISLSDLKGPRLFPFAALLLILVGLICYDSVINEELYSVFDCPVPTSKTFRNNEFQSWLRCVRTNRTSLCPVYKLRPTKPSLCFAAEQLGYKNTHPAAPQRPFIKSVAFCPGHLRDDTIYVCNRHRELWSNQVQRNKYKMWNIYEYYDTSIHNNSLPKDCGNIRLKEFFPTMFTLNSEEDILNFETELKAQTKPEKQYIFKLAKGGYQGKGSLIYNVRESLDLLKGYPFDHHLVAQEYNGNPFLWEGKKFNIRVFATVFNDDPVMMTFSSAYLSRAFVNYTDVTPGKQLAAHIPNAGRNEIGDVTVQELHESKSGFAKFDEYLKADKENRKIYLENGTTSYLPEDWLYETAVPNMERMVQYLLKSTWLNSEEFINLKDLFKFGSGTPHDRLKDSGWFDSTHISYICFDLLFDNEGKIWMHEENHGCGMVFDFDGRSETPLWREEMFRSIQVQALKIAEEIYYRKKLNVSFGFDDLTTSLKDHSVLVDHTKQLHLPREERTFCSGERLDF